MTDFHAHILPAMDDGARHLSEAAEMMSLSFRRGVRSLVATPHFYGDTEAPEEFLARRKKAVETLIDAEKHDPWPTLYLGAEVAYFPGISKARQTEDLCIVGTNVMLIEMPFEPWTSTMFDELYRLKKMRGITPMLAHIDRYLPLIPKKEMPNLLDAGILVQMNLSFLKEHPYRAMRLVRSGWVHLLGSDCHRATGERAPGIDLTQIRPDDPQLALFCEDAEELASAVLEYAEVFSHG